MKKATLLTWLLGLKSIPNYLSLQQRGLRNGTAN